MSSSSAALAAQLRRMRAMNYRYHALFFRYINFWIGTNALLLVVSLFEPLRAAILLVPHLILYGAMQGAFHFHYMLFARRFARALEAKLNGLSEQPVLIASELEERYLGPLDSPRFVGFNFGAPLSFFSAITLHYGIAGSLVWAIAVYRAMQLAAELSARFPPLAFYVPVTLLWTAANMLYLAWYFLVRRDERAVEARLIEFVGK